MLWSEQLMMHSKSMTTVSNDDNKEDKDHFLAIIFITCNDFNRLSTLAKDLLREYIQGTDKFPTAVTRAHELLQEYEASSLAKTHKNNNHNQGNSNNNKNTIDNTPRVSFAQAESKSDETVPDTDGSLLNNLSIRCFKCQKRDIWGIIVQIADHRKIHSLS